MADEETITITRAEYDKLRQRIGIRYYLDDIEFMRMQGATLQQIANKYGVTRQRIHQLLTEPVL
jgi:DNA-directed RNA polymerase sigma subunit (sigma70/sigma32)